MFGRGGATESWREEWGEEKLAHFSSLRRFSVPKQVSLLAGYETFGVNVAVEQVGAIFWAQTMQSMACS